MAKPLLLLLGTIVLIGCASWRQGATMSDYQGQVLRVRENGPGAARLKIEIAYDTTVQHYVDQNGEPDYVRVRSLYQLELFYIDADAIVLFDRGVFSTKSQTAVTREIPEDISSRFVFADRERLREARLRQMFLQTRP